MRALLLIALLAGCTSEIGDSPDTDTGAADAGTDVVDTDTDAGDTDTDDTDTDDTDTGDTDEPDAPPALRLIAMGDGGEGNDAQYAVARAVKTVCDRDGCDAVLYLGDNFYDDGVDSLDDPQWQTKFELPYADLDLPFLAALGNHDNGGFGGAGFEFWRGDLQVEYANSGKSDKFTMPDRTYVKRFEGKPGMLIALDTNSMMFDVDLDEQAGFVRGALAAARDEVTIAFGHHPYISNGKHGNAGRYEGIPYIPIVSGEDVKDFFDDEVCGKVDVYICGHDHNMQWLGPADRCATEFLVSGAAAKTTELEGRGNDVFYETDATEGFMWLELVGRTLTGRVYDRDANLLYEQTVEL